MFGTDGRKDSEAGEWSFAASYFASYFSGA